ncbi:hypothetical protein OG373_39975 [Streptomyces avidinii]|uniref:hypothetical protein n=1 Tax=Streptomyces avidinii TaxID=1895 RepID=UPI00386E62D9|nr:hypothetical protein OG373_39975 [Streptomyces avidinii]
MLGPARDPVDVLALIDEIADTWAGRPEIGAAAARQADDASIEVRRTALGHRRRVPPPPAAEPAD